MKRSVLALVQSAVWIVIVGLTVACGSTSSETLTGPVAKCTVAVTPPDGAIASNGGSGTIAVTTTPECDWVATSEASWITDLEPARGQGSGQVRFRATPNPTGTSRETAVAINGQRAIVRQNASACEIDAAASATQFPASGGAGAVTISAPGGCSWTATSDVAWIALSSPSGSGSGTVGFTVSANGGSARVGTIMVGGVSVGIAQAATGGPAPPAPGCTFTINPTSQSVPAAGASGITVSVTAAAGCAWTAASNAAWLTFASAASGSGNGSVRVNVAANDGAARTGTMTIAGRTFTVTQAAGCGYAISPTSMTVGDESVQGMSVAVTAMPGCSWTATSNAGWLALEGATTGTGNGTVSFAVSDFSGTSRTGTLTIAGRTFTVTQVRCSATITPTSQDVTALGGSFEVSVMTQIGCGWGADENLDWVTVTSGSRGRGNGIVRYLVAFNAGEGRSGQISIAGQTLTIHQGAVIP